MLVLLIVLLSAYSLLLEVRIQADLQHGDGTRTRFIVDIAGIHKTWQMLLARTSQGHQVMLAQEDGVHPLSSAKLRTDRGRLLWRLFRRADRARHFLLHHVHLEQLHVLALFRTEDAAGSALLSGTLQSIAACIPALRRRNVCIRVLPEFFRAHSTVKARCIIRLRLGTIILTAMMLLIAYLRQQRMTESEAL